MPAFAATLDAELAALEARGLRRVLRAIESASDPEVTIDGRRLVLLSSNNYLGLATHPALVAASVEATQRWGCSAGSSRLIAGHFALHADVEATLARLKGTEAALLFPSGYQANVGSITALIGPGDHVFSDALNHASIIDGCRLSRAQVHVYPHGDVAALAALLDATPRAGRRLIVTDSVFSMDGDRAPLAALVEAAEAYHAWLMVDEAHATGVFGSRGAGLAEETGLTARIPIHMGTLGKALGGVGAYVAGSQALIDLLVNRARSFVFTTGLPPAAVAAAGAALALLAEEPERRTQVRAHAQTLREGLTAMGFTVSGDTQIVPVLVGDVAPTMALGRALFERGILAHPIRPPTVPHGTCRIRLTPMATHTTDHMTRTLDAFAEAGRATGVLR